MFWLLTTDWDDAANIATIIEAAVVIVSVLFIWLQIKQQTKLTRVARAQDLVNLSSPFNLDLVKDERLALLWSNGSAGYNNFPEGKKARYKNMLIWWLIFHENIYYQKNEGLLDENIYNSWQADLEFFIRKQPLAPVWPELEGAFEKKFREHVTTLINKHTTTLTNTDPK